MLKRYRFVDPNARDVSAALLIQLNEDFQKRRGHGGNTHCGVHVCDIDCKDLLALTAEPPFVPLDTTHHGVKVTVSTVKLDPTSCTLTGNMTGTTVGGSRTQSKVPPQQEPLYRYGDLSDLERRFYGFPEVYFTAIWDNTVLFSKRALHYLHISTELLERTEAAKEAITAEEQKSADQSDTTRLIQHLYFCFLHREDCTSRRTCEIGAEGADSPTLSGG